MRRTFALCVVACVALVGCAETPRTGTNFCRQLATEMPEIAIAPATELDVENAVERFKRLAKLAPLEIEQQWNALTELMIATSQVDATDPDSVQRVVDLAYATEVSATTAASWVQATCGVDISQGVQVTP